MYKKSCLSYQQVHEKFISVCYCAGPENIHTYLMKVIGNS